MGEQLQKVSMKWSPATLQHEAELLDAFSGLVEGRSQLSRVTMKIAWRLVRTVGILRVIEEFVQDKPCETAPDVVAQSLTQVFSGVQGTELGKKPLVRVPSSEVGANRRALRFTDVSANSAYKSPFFKRIGPLKFNRWVA